MNARSAITMALALTALVAVVPVRDVQAQVTFLTAWGTPGSGAGQFNTPVSVAIAPTGDVYVSDQNNSRIQRFTNDGVYLGQWGSFGTDDGQFKNPISIAVDDAGAVYVADAGNNRVQKFAADGTFLGKWGTQGAAPGQFDLPHCVAFSGGVIYVSDVVNKRLQTFSPDGALLGVLATNFDFDGIAVDASGFVYAVLPASKKVSVFDPSGALVAQWQGGTGLDPIRVAVDGRGHVFVDYLDHRMAAFTTAGAFLFNWGSVGSAPGQFNNPIGIGVDSNNNIFVCDTNNQRIEKFGPGAVPTTVTTWGSVKALYR